MRTHSDAKIEGAIDYEGIGGWLWVPIASFIITMLGAIYLMLNGGAAISELKYFLFGIMAYCSASIALTFLRFRLAKYMSMLFFAAAFLAEIFGGGMMIAQGRFNFEQTFAAIMKAVVTLSLFLYFIFSVRVKQTLTR